MTQYKCGHKEHTVVMNTTPLILATYFTWKDTEGRDGTKEKCFNCYCKEKV